MRDGRTAAFPRDFRLRSAAEFKNVYERGARRVSLSFVVFALKNDRNYSRFGVTASRKLGKAHDRNRIKRRVRELLRTSRTSIPRGLDVVVNPRRSARDRDIEELRHELIALFGAQE